MPKLQLLTRRQGRDPAEWSDRKRQGGGFVDPATLARDFMILALAPSTWKSYAAWWGVFEEWCGQRGVQEMSARTVQVMQVELEMMVGSLGQEYALSTIETVVSAVVKKFEMEQWGEIRRKNSNLKAIMRGIELWWGRAGVKKVKPVQASHIATLVTLRDLPRTWTWAGVWGWRQAVAMVCLAWLVGARPKVFV